MDSRRISSRFSWTTTTIRRGSNDSLVDVLGAAFERVVVLVTAFPKARSRLK